MLRRVKQLAGREAHTLALSEDGNVGRGTFGRLGTGKEHDEHSPVRVYFPETSSLKKSTDPSVPSGKSDSSRTLFVGIAADDGSVWSWDYNACLGLCPDASLRGDDAGDALSPLRMHRAEGVKQVACGAAHTLVVTDDGHKLWAWGRGRSGVLGHGKTTDSFMPFPVLWPPPDEDFKENNMDAQDEKTKPSNQEAGKVANTCEEIEFLRSKLTLMERYASLLHVSIFRKQLDDRNLPQSLQGSGVFDVGKELETLLESADDHELARMEMFYRNMLASVKDKLLKRRVQEMVKETLRSLPAGSHSYTRPNVKGLTLVAGVCIGNDISAGLAAAGVTNLNRAGIRHSALSDFCKPLHRFCDQMAVSLTFAFLSCLFLAISAILDVLWLSYY